MGFWKEALRERVNVEVLAGHPTNAKYVNIAGGDKPGEILVEVGPRTKRAYKPDSIRWSESSTRSGGAAAAGAIAGGLVGGAIGGIAGAAVGGRKRDNSKAYIDLVDAETGEEITLHIRCNAAQYRQIDGLIRRTKMAK
jgi:hypothetical protein